MNKESCTFTKEKTKKRSDKIKKLRKINLFCTIKQTDRIIKKTNDELKEKFLLKLNICKITKRLRNKLKLEQRN